MPSEPLHLTLYTRSGCHLCDDAIKTLDEHGRQYRFSLQLVDIDRDPALAKQFGECVPVLAIGAKVRFRGRINPALLKRLLQNPCDPTDDGS